MKKLMYLVMFVISLSFAYAATGDYVANVNFATPCPSGIGVGIAFDGQNLWYSCYSSNPDLYRADPLTGAVTATYNIDGGLGALSYDRTRNVIWAGFDDERMNVYKIVLDSGKNVVSSSVAFNPAVQGLDLDDGLAYDASDDTFYLSPDVSSTIYHLDINGNILGSFAPTSGSNCGNSGLALGGDLLYQGFDGCNQVIVANKSNVATQAFTFSTTQASDSAFRDEDLECDPVTFKSAGKEVMWSVEAYDTNFGSGYGNRRAYAFEIPSGSCGLGGTTHTDDIPEFGVIAGIVALIGAVGIVAFKRK